MTKTSCTSTATTTTNNNNNKNNNNNSNNDGNCSISTTTTTTTATVTTDNHNDNNKDVAKSTNNNSSSSCSNNHRQQKQYDDMIMSILPLIPPTLFMIPLLDNPFIILGGWMNQFINMIMMMTTTTTNNDDDDESVLSQQEQQEQQLTVSEQLIAFIIVSILGYITTYQLVPHIKQYTLRKGICGKDLGKRGTKLANNDIPEALGIVPGGVFLVCLIFCIVGYAATSPDKMSDVNAALLSICFMIFLGFTDDVLDWPWRYKLILPTIASLPLLCSYTGSTSIVVPIQLRSFLWYDGQVTTFGDILSHFIIIDSAAEGSLINLGYIYLLYMGMLAVFCTNAINIYAGINGLEAGQSYIIACAILCHNFIEIRSGALIDNHMFSVMIMLPFIAVTVGILQHNWYPSTIFVGDTYCYFAGMTFAVVGIFGHFSKTLLLLFIPQIINFVWSIPQLFKLVPCPRHRLPTYNSITGYMEPSTYKCKSILSQQQQQKQQQYRWLTMMMKKQNNPNDDDDTQQEEEEEEVPNMTVINLCLQIVGPMKEKTLCTVLLLFQVLCCTVGFICRYYIAPFFFDE